MKLFLLLLLICLNCYSNPRNKILKKKPMYIIQYEKLNEEEAKKNKLKQKKEVLKMKETKIKFKKEKVYESRK